ncbi:MAG: peptidoglycan DD-metalloendopeptidase family protein [Candidatus Shapirobacteria bacterium]|nr:peptidoglycan DD-metalloendopeptidase family protein [Candidatus Shapirobacteria bacterium]
MIQEKELVNLEEFLPIIYDLQEKNWPHQDISRKDALDKIIQLAQILGVNIDPNDPEFLPLMTVKIVEISSQSKNQEAPDIPPNLSELVEIYEKDKEKETLELQKKVSSKENQKRYRNFNEEFRKIITKANIQIPKPLVEEMAKNATDKTIASLPPVAQADFFTEEIKNQVLKEAEKIVNDELKKVTKNQVLKEAEKIVNDELKKIKEEATRGKTQNLITEAQEIAATPAIIKPFQEVTKITSPILDATLPQAILDQLAQNDGVAFLPLYTVLYPKATAAFIERGIYTLPAKILKLAADDASPEWQAMITQGIFAEDFEFTIRRLRELGVSEKHPVLVKLNDKFARFQEQQKIEYKDKNGNVHYKDKPAAAFLKRFYKFDKITGRQRISYDRIPFPNNTDWSKGGYAGSIKNGLNHFKFIINTYERFSKFVTKGQYTSFLTPIRQFFSQKVGQPIVHWLAKTAAGKAVKAGVKKAATWLATRLGVEIGATVAGTAAGGVPGVVIAAASIVFELLKKVGGKIIGFIRQIINDPEKGLMAIGIGIAVLVFIPNPFNLFGIIPLVFGGLGLASFVMAPITLGAIGGGIGVFFTALAAPVIFPVALFLIIVLSTLAVLTLFIVLVVSGSFILPAKVTETTVTNVSAYESPYFKLEKTADRTKIDNSELSNNPEIKYIVTIKANDGYSLRIINIKDNFSFSTDGKQLTLPTYSFSKDLNEKGREISSGTTWQVDYTTQVDSRFENTAITNTINATLAVEGIDGSFPGTTSTVVIIGSPPMDCPSGWPTSGKIAQGPEGATSHGPHHEEAIDIGANRGTPVYATHKGTATIGHQTFGAGYYIDIAGTCEGKIFHTRYYHLLERDRVSGSVIKGQIIGYVDSSGGPYASHLHYEFQPYGILKMEPKNIPLNLPSRSCNSSAQCNTKTTAP